MNLYGKNGKQRRRYLIRSELALKYNRQISWSFKNSKEMMLMNPIFNMIREVNEWLHAAEYQALLNSALPK